MWNGRTIEGNEINITNLFITCFGLIYIYILKNITGSISGRRNAIPDIFFFLHRVGHLAMRRAGYLRAL